MKALFKYSAASTMALTLMVTGPASAQLLGGGGELAGGMTGAIIRTSGTATGTASGSGQVDKKADTRTGRVQGSGTAQGDATGSVAGSSQRADRTSTATANGGAKGSATKNADVTLVGTDQIGAATAEGAARARTTGTAAGEKARGAGQSVAGMASAGVNASGNGAVSGRNIALGSEGQLAVAGSAAAQRPGMFTVQPGMAVTDSKGRVIGYVHQVGQTKRGVVETISVEVGNRVATLSAARFSGSGELLVTGMTKGELKSAAKKQEAEQADGSPAGDSEAASNDRSADGMQQPASTASKPSKPSTTSQRSTSGESARSGGGGARNERQAPRQNQH